MAAKKGKRGKGKAAPAPKAVKEVEEPVAEEEPQEEERAESPEREEELVEEVTPKNTPVKKPPPPKATPKKGRKRAASASPSPAKRGGRQLARAAKTPKPPAPKPSTPVKKTPAKRKMSKVSKVKKMKTTAGGGHQGSSLSYSEMVREAIHTLGAENPRRGVSRQSILNYIMRKHKRGEEERHVNINVKKALRKGVKDCTLNQVSGIGASGSFKAPKE